MHHASPKDAASIALLIRRVYSSVSAMPVHEKFSFSAAAPVTCANDVVFVHMRLERNVES
jgi:hypothetical protein